FLQLEGRALHLGDQAPEFRVDRVDATVWPREPQTEVRLDRGVEIAARKRRFLFLAERLHLRGPLVPVQAGPDQHERPDLLRRFERELEGNPSAEGDTDERGSLAAGSSKRVPDGCAVVDDC